jgi:hypothetical protein
VLGTLGSYLGGDCPTSVEKSSVGNNHKESVERHKLDRDFLSEAKEMSPNNLYVRIEHAGSRISHEQVKEFQKLHLPKDRCNMGKI